MARTTTLPLNNFIINQLISEINSYIKEKIIRK